MDFADEWDELPEDEQIMTALEWSDAMGHLRSLEEEYTVGALSEEQQEPYRQLKAHLEATLPIIDRLGLARPQEILDN